MRIIGQLAGETNARNFSNFLYVQGIDNQVEAEKDGAWAIWIHAEEELDRARGLLAEYQANPADPKFKGTGQLADKLRERKKQEQEDYEKRVKKRRHLFRPMTAYGFGPLTFAMILISVGVYLYQHGFFTSDINGVTRLFISEYDRPAGNLGLPEVREGQVWRLVTPIFLHFGIMHIFFNMLWLRDLGSMIEGRQNSWYLFVFVLVVAVGSNLTQYFVVGPAFGGMSGVIYGLMGYIWIRGKRDPGSGLYLHPSTVTMMIFWFFFCFTPWSSGAVGRGGVANGCHTGGLLMGMAWGWLASLKRR